MNQHGPIQEGVGVRVWIGEGPVLAPALEMTLVVDTEETWPNEGPFSDRLERAFSSSLGLLTLMLVHLGALHAGVMRLLEDPWGWARELDQEEK